MKKKDTPDVMGAMQTKPRRGRPPKVKPTLTADQIADSMEAEGRKWLHLAKVARGKAKVE